MNKKDGRYFKLKQFYKFVILINKIKSVGPHIFFFFPLTLLHLGPNI